MSQSIDSIEFRRGVIQPVECIKEGYGLIKDQYWLFVGMAAIGVLIGNAVPFGILMGPMMVGLYMALFRKRRGEPVEFGILFKGFDSFGDSVIATLLHVIPIAVIIVPAYIIFYVGVILSMQAGGGEPDPAAMFGLFAFFLVFWITAILIIMVISVLFTFAYPLIADRKLKGMDAVKLSIRAALANFWRLLGLSLLNGLLMIGGIVLCYVGVFLVIPITLAALAVAYERVFGLGQFQPNLPPPPPIFS
ncbi:MAG TPA: hypothetical protein VJV03_18710 [Pyrinomonadaceae bacterium]|nr:hypothetical protein [Pyrinomonadaceae bacterium]